MATAGGAAFAAAVRVIHRVHRDAAHVRPDAEPARAAGLADGHVLVLGVADLPDRGEAAREHLARLARGQLQLRVLRLERHQLRAHARRAHQLPAGARLELDVVHERAGRDQPQRQRVARLDLGALAGLDHVAHVQAGRRQDVALVAVGVVEQSDPRGAVRVVLDRGDLRGDVALVAAEVDLAVALLVAAAAVVAGDLAAVVAAARARLALGEPLLGGGLRDLDEVLHRHAAPAGRSRFEVSRRQLTLPRRTRSNRPRAAARAPSSTTGAGPGSCRPGASCRARAACGRPRPSRRRAPRPRA